MGQNWPSNSNAKNTNSWLKSVFLQQLTRLTQPCIPLGSLNRVPAVAGVRAGMSALPGGR